MREEKKVVVSGVIIQDPEGRLLTVRKQGTGRFMLPGGKPEPGEAAEATAIREAAEEIQVALDPAKLYCHGTFHARAANEAGFTVESTLFQHPYLGPVEPAAEIAELRWLDFSRSRLPEDLAPLVTDVVLPILRGEKISTAKGD